jgi:hypothetical protein
LLAHGWKDLLIACHYSLRLWSQGKCSQLDEWIQWHHQSHIIFIRVWTASRSFGALGKLEDNSEHRIRDQEIHQLGIEGTRELLLWSTQLGVIISLLIGNLHVWMMGFPLNSRGATWSTAETWSFNAVHNQQTEIL